MRLVAPPDASFNLPTLLNLAQKGRLHLLDLRSQALPSGDQLPSDPELFIRPQRAVHSSPRFSRLASSAARADACAFV